MSGKSSPSLNSTFSYQKSSHQPFLNAVSRCRLWGWFPVKYFWQAN